MTPSSAIIGTSIDDAATHLRQDGVVAIPTETVYGLAGNATSRKAVLKIFEVKQRPSFDPLIVHTHQAEEFGKYAQVNDRFLAIVEKLSPGPITYILPKKNSIPDVVTSGHPTVGLRIPRHELTLSLLQNLEFPLAAPSANPFGYVSPTTAQHVNRQLGHLIPYILDGGPSLVGIESTILDFSRSNPKVLRLGGYALEELEEALDLKLNDIQLSSSAPHAPGMLHSHYAPKVTLTAAPIAEVIDQHPKAKVGAIRFNTWSKELPKAQQRLLSETGDMREAAQSLFRVLRELDELDWDIAAVEMVPNVGLGLAINDRLTRATHR